MRYPIVCLNAELNNYLTCFRHCFSKPQMKHFVIMLLGLMLCEGGHTLSDTLRQVEQKSSLSGASRFLSTAPWSLEQVSQTWQTTFETELRPLVEAEHRRQRDAQRAERRKRGHKGGGRLRKPVVTGYLIGDDSTMHKRRGKKMGGIGYHHSSTERKRVKGHSLVQGLYLLLGRRCPLQPEMYTQKAVCEAENRPFRSKITIMIDIINTFQPVAGTETHVLLDSWYTAKSVWKAARERGFLITSGLKCNRSLRLPRPDAPEGEKQWRWQRVDTYAASLSDDQFTKTVWPTTGETVYVHTISTRVKKLYRCQVIIVCNSLDADRTTRYWASSDLNADLDTLLTHIATRWQIEQLFADLKEILGLDQYQLMRVTSIERFWGLVIVAYTFLDRHRSHLQHQKQQHTTIGDAWRDIRRGHHAALITWIVEAVTDERYTIAELHEELLA